MTSTYPIFFWTVTGNKQISELLIATRITLFVAGDEIKIALSCNTGSIWHPQGAGRLEFSSIARPKSWVGCIPLVPSHSLNWRLLMRNN